MESTVCTDMQSRFLLIYNKNKSIGIDRGEHERFFKTLQNAD